MNLPKTLIYFFIIILVCICDSAIAGWSGPVPVVTGNWGKAEGQIGIEYGDTADDFPRSFGVSRSGKIVIADPINEVLHIFDGNGIFIRDIKNPQVWAGWPYSVKVNDECAVVGYVEMTHTFNISTGSLIGKAVNMGGANYVNEDCSKIIVGGQYKTGERWNVYSPTGQVFSTSSTKPLELGVVKEQKIGSQYRIIVSYLDKEYSLMLAEPYGEYVRDSKGYIYQVAGKSIKKFNNCGKELGSLNIPMDESKVIKPGGRGFDQINELIAEYGDPIVSPNGDVYTWKRTPNKYIILKWTWGDDSRVSEEKCK